jgi:hypothetical protein
MPLRDLYEISGGEIKLNFHAGQWKAWESTRRFVTVLAGTQGGKTSFGPIWFYREIQTRGPGDYLVVTPTFSLLELKALPTLLKLFDTWLKLGRFVGSPVRRFTLSEEGSKRTFGDRFDSQTPTNIFFGYASDPDSLESATAKAAWLDEAGQRRFKLSSWEAIQRRLSLAQGRALITTTPYDLGWLKQKIWDRWKAGEPDYDVIRFDSTENPQFPQEEFERARRELPRWKFDMFYRAIFTRPAGMIYDAFDEQQHKTPRSAIPDRWQRYLGLDFGGVNTAGLFYAEEPGTGKLYLYREYKAGGRTAKEHAEHLLKGEPMVPICVGGSKSEGQWRKEFRAAGLPVRETAITDVEIGIDRVYGAHRENQILVFDDLAGYLEEKMTYSRKLDEAGEPTAEIEDKHSFHFMDAERYIIGWLRKTSKTPLVGPIVPTTKSTWRLSVGG